jgi:hypothetical protein
MTKKYLEDYYKPEVDFEDKIQEAIENETNDLIFEQNRDYEEIIKENN